jgi:hypothetical protein
MYRAASIEDGINARRRHPANRQRLANHEDLKRHHPQHLSQAFHHKRYCAMCHWG